MEKCPNCGQELPLTATEFCPHCGYQLTQVQANTTPASQTDQKTEPVAAETVRPTSAQTGSPAATATTATPMDPVGPVEQIPVDKSTGQTVAQDSAGDPNVDEADDEDQDEDYLEVQPSPTWRFIKDYFKSLNANVIHPQLEQPETNWFGLINLGLIALLTSLALSRFASKLINLFLMNLNFMGLRLNLQSQGRMIGFWFILILVVLIFAVRVLALWAFQHLALKQSTSFLGALNQIFMPISLAVYTSLAGFVLSLIIAPSTFLGYLILVPFILINVAFVGALWVDSQEQSQGQRFYLILITVIITTLLIGVVARMVLGTMVQQLNLSSLLSRFMGN
ncbi:DUF6574 domain-containing protein [Lapidilactobacillus luobeiensis]|uniref:DUF6574 domain-containing protein n=1 Tax=Lapidilactobacillus luobeiensis TaxID=2950371 RepID=UPI0021C365C1|nr:DUF6574 domain-containing protein [Lapidilactobacillus luobeiensis]